MLGLVNDPDQMTPHQAFRGCLMLCVAVSSLMIGGGILTWLLADAGFLK
jgi:hypothetical protein